MLAFVVVSLVLHLIFQVRESHGLFNLSIFLLGLTYLIGGFYLFKSLDLRTSLKIISGFLLGIPILALPFIISLQRSDYRIYLIIPVSVLLVFITSKDLSSTNKKAQFKKHNALLIRLSLCILVFTFFAFASPKNGFYRTIAKTLNNDIPSLVHNLNGFDFYRKSKKAKQKSDFINAIKYGEKSKEEFLQWLDIDINDTITDSKYELVKVLGSLTNLYYLYKEIGNKEFDAGDYNKAQEYYQLAQYNLHIADTIPSNARLEPTGILWDRASAYHKSQNYTLGDSLYVEAILSFKKDNLTDSVSFARMFRDYGGLLKEQEYYSESNEIYNLSNQLFESTQGSNLEIINNNIKIAKNLFDLDSLNKSILTIESNYEKIPEENSQLCTNLFYHAIYTYNKGEINQARELGLESRDCLIKFKKSLSQNYVLTHYVLALTSTTQSNYNRALNEIQKANYSILNNPKIESSIINSLDVLEASILTELGNYQRAREILEMVTKSNNEDSFSKLAGLLTLTEIYNTLGHYSKFKAGLVKSEQMMLESIDYEHTSSFGTLNSIAHLHYLNGSLSKADSLYTTVISSPKEYYKGVLATALNGKGLALLEKNDFSKASDLFQKSLKINEEMFGLNHSSILKTYYNRAVLEYRRNNYNVAKELLNTADSIIKTIYPLDHDLYADLAFLKAKIYQKEGNREQAILLSQRAKDIYTNKFDPNHPLVDDVSNFIENLRSF